MVTLLAPTASDTFALGVRLGRAAAAGTVLALIGDLGAGKTVLARGLGQGLGVTTTVRSPSFIVVQAHSGGRLPLWHADLYRVTDLDELEQLGLDELLESDGVVAIEWAERFPVLLPTDHLELRFHEQGDVRRIEVRASGPLHAPMERACVG